ncbi:MAG: tetratricopeptide repeat protein [Polyangiaceae bacterium]|nr:tetratricopeptide repeat protein [Polyangiaceae bacterium]
MLASLLALNASCTAKARPAAAPGASIVKRRCRMLGKLRWTVISMNRGASTGELLVQKRTRRRSASGPRARACVERRHDRAEELYRDVLARHPSDDDVRTGLFNVLVWDHRWKDAELLLDEAPAQHTPGLLTLRARLLHADGNVTKARALIERAERLAPHDGDIRALRYRMYTRSARMTTRGASLGTARQRSAKWT